MAGDRRHRWASMRVRTTVAATAVVGLALLVAATALLAVLRRSLVDNVETAARLRATDVAALLESGAAPEELAVEEDDDGDAESSLVQVLDGDGEVRIASPNVRGQPPVAEVAAGSSRRVSGLSISPEDPYLVVAEAATDDQGTRWTVLVARALEPTDETVGRVLRVLLAGVPLLVALVAWTTWFVVGRALRPVAAISAEVRSITDRELDRRVPEGDVDDEIGSLARTMNAMLDRLHDARDRQRQFVSDASHELRSPIASMRHQLEVAVAHPERTDLGRLVGDLLDEDLRMEQVVDDLLLLARMDEGSPAGGRDHVDLDDVALAEVRRVRATADVRVDGSGVTAARVRGNRTHLSRAVGNLLENAARHATSRVAVTVETQGDLAVLRVDDDGPGIVETDRERVFERFTRLDDDRSRVGGGAGLGLAIARAVADQHGGQLRCLDAPGGGARFELRLPIATDS